MIYLDSAAVVKLIREEESSLELVKWIRTRPQLVLVSSCLVEVEVPRAIRRTAPEALPAIPATLARLNRREIDAAIRASAAAFTDSKLRSLDAIHLATALSFSPNELEAFVTYDARLLIAASQIGLPIAQPS